MTTNNSARKQQRWFTAWYKKLGFNLTIPTPNVTDVQYKVCVRKGQMLCYRPATSEVSYEAFMIAVGHGDHWTVTDKCDRAKIGWELAAQGYWFWAEAPYDCPRLGTTWNNLVKTVKLLSLEEYAIVWHAVKEMDGRMLDVRTWCLLRTRFGQGALNADGVGGRVSVSGDSADDLSIPYGGEGGRAAEVVKK